MHMPPASAATCPSREVPVPNAMTGVLYVGAELDDCRHLIGALGKRDGIGSMRRMIRIRLCRAARRPLPRWKAGHRAARVRRRVAIHLAGNGEGRQMRTWRQPISDELVPESPQLLRRGTAATAVDAAAWSRANIRSLSGGTVRVTLIRGSPH